MKTLANVATKIFYILIAGPCAGKDTLQAMIQLHGIRGFSCSASIDLGIENGIYSDAEVREIQNTRDRGDLVRDELVYRALDKVFKNLSGELSANGFPRTVGQALYLKQVIQGRDIQVVYLHIEIPDEVCIERAKYRIKQFMNEGKKPRTDDLEIEYRLKIYHENLESILPLLDTFARRVPIDGNRSKEEVWKDVEHCIRQTKA